MGGLVATGSLNLGVRILDWETGAGRSAKVADLEIGVTGCGGIVIAFGEPAGGHARQLKNPNLLENK